MSAYRPQTETWLFQRLAASAGHKERLTLREIVRATIRYTVLFIVIQLMGAAIIMYLVARKDGAADQRGAENQLAAVKVAVPDSPGPSPPHADVHWQQQ
jgi:hypothetical protein